MSVQIFNVAGWSFTQNDEKALAKLEQLKLEASKELPLSYKSQLIVCLFEEMSRTRLFKALKTIPKGVIHHIHFDCTEDQQFYAKYIITDPIVYLTKDLDGFQVGTKAEANHKGWISMDEARTKFGTQQQFVKHVSNLTMLSQKQIGQNFSQKLTLDQCWAKFQKKIVNFFPLLGAVHIFKKYTIHILRKYIKNGYDRMEFRALLTKLNEYNQATGELIQTHDQVKFMQTFDQAFDIVKKEHPVFSVGFIFFGLKFQSKQQNQQILTTVLEKRWPKTIGIDFVQQEDPNGSQQPYDDVANKVLAKFPQDNIKKVYHSGQTKDHLNKNVEISINAGSARIGHGINVVQHPYMIEVCKQKKICFEKSPISNLVLSYVTDPRGATAQLLLGLGVPITINPDDPGKFGLDDTTMDYLVTLISSNWDLRHLKLIALHSITYAITSNQHKQQLLASFNKRWNQWVSHFISV